MQVAVKVLAAADRAALSARSRHLLLRRPARRAALGRGAAAAAAGGGGNHGALGLDRDGSAARGRRAGRSSPRTPAATLTFACRRSTGSAPRGDVLTTEWIDGIPLADREALRARRPRPGAARARADPVVPAPGAARRLLPRRPASGKPVRRCRRPAGGGRLRDHGAARAEGAQVPGRDSVRLHHARLAPHGRSAFRGRLRARAPLDRGLRAGDPRHRRADP